METSIMPSNLKAAYVSCYVAGDNYIEASEKSLKKLISDGLHPEEILQPIHVMDSKDWTRHVDEKWNAFSASLPTQAEFEKAIKEGQIVYGPFGSYS